MTPHEAPPAAVGVPGVGVTRVAGAARPAGRPRGGPLGRVRAFLRLVAIEHSVFALPFAYIAALYAAFPAVAELRLVLITLAMVAARTFAMAANRLVDRELDARNPRTARRELVTGDVGVTTARVGAAVSLAVFLAVAAVLPEPCLALAPVALALLVIYPYGKRFTWGCHGLLALAQAVAPIGAWLAVTGRVTGASLSLGVAVGMWIGGFDVIYALQDLDHDRRDGIYSLPARFGARVALVVSALTHVVTLGLFVLFGLLVHAGGWWWGGCAVTAVAFSYEHAIVRPGDLSRVNRAFFTANGAVGIVLFGFALADVASRGLRL